MTNVNINSPERFSFIQDLLNKKWGLRAIYSENYAKYKSCCEKSPKGGLVIEIGSGGGFVKEVVPEVQTSDIIAYSNVDLIVDSTKMPFKDNSVSCLLMTNVFHHIPDVTAFLQEATRCLVPGGKILMIDQHVGFLSYFFLKYLHHEPFDHKTTSWKFASTGPLSGANGALSWIVFKRDRAIFEKMFGQSLVLNRYAPHTPLRYWMSGGLKKWTLLPSFIYKPVLFLESILLKLSPDWGSFVDIELTKKG